MCVCPTFAADVLHRVTSFSCAALNVTLLRAALGRSEDGSSSPVAENAWESMVSVDVRLVCITADALDASKRPGYLNIEGFIESLRGSQPIPTYCCPPVFFGHVLSYGPTRRVCFASESLQHRGELRQPPVIAWFCLDHRTYAPNRFGRPFYVCDA